MRRQRAAPSRGPAGAGPDGRATPTRKRRRTARDRPHGSQPPSPSQRGNGTAAPSDPCTVWSWGPSGRKGWWDGEPQWSTPFAFVPDPSRVFARQIGGTGYMRRGARFVPEGPVRRLGYARGCGGIAAPPSAQGPLSSDRPPCFIHSPSSAAFSFSNCNQASSPNDVVPMDLGEEDNSGSVLDGAPAFVQDAAPPAPPLPPPPPSRLRLHRLAGRLRTRCPSPSR